MPHPRHNNPKFLALPVTGRNELAETPCAICDRIASVKRRADGWIEIRCGKNGCGYTETAMLAESFDDLMNTVLNDEKTQFRRASRSDVLEALGREEKKPVELEPAPIEPAPVEKKQESETGDDLKEKPAPATAKEGAAPVAPQSDDVENEDHIAMFGE